jgi:hypothetical protein
MGRSIKQEPRDRKYNTRRSAVQYLIRQGVSEPIEDTHYTLYRQDGGWCWRLITEIKETPVQAPTPTTNITQHPTAEGMRPLSRPERRRIVDALEQRYRKDWSDQKLADKLNLPRAWLTQIRVEQFGDYDRNEVQDQAAVKFKETIALAEKTRDKLLQLATEAEGILNDLKRKAGISPL